MNNVYWQPGVTLADLEKQAIRSAMRAFEFNKTKAAQALGISVRTLYNKLEAYGDLKDGEHFTEEIDNPVSGHADSGKEELSLQNAAGHDVESVEKATTKRAVPLRKR